MHHFFFCRNIERQPIPETPLGEVIHLHTFPQKRGNGASSHYSLVPSESASDRRPDGAEEPDLAIGDRRDSKSSMLKSADTLLSSHSRLQQIPEREPLMNSGYRQADSPPPYNSRERPRPFESKVVSAIMYWNTDLYWFAVVKSLLTAAWKKGLERRDKLVGSDSFAQKNKTSIPQFKWNLEFMKSRKMAAKLGIRKNPAKLERRFFVIFHKSKKLRNWVQTFLE